MANTIVWSRTSVLQITTVSLIQKKSCYELPCSRAHLRNVEVTLRPNLLRLLHGEWVSPFPVVACWEWVAIARNSLLIQLVVISVQMPSGIAKLHQGSCQALLSNCLIDQIHAQSLWSALSPRGDRVSVPAFINNAALPSPVPWWSIVPINHSFNWECFSRVIWKTPLWVAILFYRRLISIIKVSMFYECLPSSCPFQLDR